MDTYKKQRSEWYEDTISPDHEGIPTWLAWLQEPDVVCNSLQACRSKADGGRAVALSTLEYSPAIPDACP
jgi:hypothetical protein